MRHMHHTKQDSPSTTHSSTHISVHIPGKTTGKTTGKKQEKGQETRPETRPEQGQGQGQGKRRKYRHERVDRAVQMEILAARAMTAYMQMRQISDVHPTVAETFRYPLTKRVCSTWHLPEVISGYTGGKATHVEAHIEVDNGGWEWEIALSWLIPVAITDEMSAEERCDLSVKSVRLPWLTVRCEGVRAVCVDLPGQLDDDLLQFIATTLMSAGTTLTHLPISRLPRPELVRIHRIA